MKIGNLLVNAAYLGSKALTAIAVGATKVWEGVSKYIKFADPVVEAICLANWDTNGDGYLSKEEAKAVTSLGTVFKGNTEITSFNELEEFINLSNTDQSFYGCSNLQSVKLPQGITNIAGNSFADCTSLTNIDIPNRVATFGLGSFARSGLTQIIIPNSVTTIAAFAFVSCSNLKTVRFGKGIKSMASDAFNGVSADYIYVDSIGAWCSYSITGVQSTDAKLYEKDVLVTDVVIPANITSLRGKIFKGFLDIKSVSFEGEVTSIGGDAFSDCGLTSFVCPQGVVTFSGAVFPRCKNLKTLDLSNYHGSLGTYFCVSCSELSFVKLGEVTAIANSAFSQCNKLKVVIIYAATPPTLGSSVFEKSAIIYVPDASVEAYKSATNWSAYADRIKPLSEYVEPTNE